VEARRSKRKKKDKLPLHPDLARRIAPWLAEKGRDAPLWAGKWAKQFTAAAMLKRDLAAARSVWIDEATTGDDRARREASDWTTPRLIDTQLTVSALFTRGHTDG